MKQAIAIGVFVAMALAQAGAPASMLIRREIVLTQGTPYKFKTAPIDPYDAFRGRYVWLSYEQRFAGYGAGFESGKKHYVPIEVGEDGFARLGSVSLTPPESGDYIYARARYWHGAEEGVQVELPDRFYLNEKIAPEAERVYRDFSAAGQRDAYVVLRVRGGMAVIEELYINDTPIAKYVRKAASAAAH